jgi:hypothetical protein
MEAKVLEQLRLIIYDRWIAKVHPDALTDNFIEYLWQRAKTVAKRFLSIYPIYRQ